MGSVGGKRFTFTGLPFCHLWPACDLCFHVCTVLTVITFCAFAHRSFHPSFRRSVPSVPAHRRAARLVSSHTLLPSLYPAGARAIRSRAAAIAAQCVCVRSAVPCRGRQLPCHVARNVRMCGDSPTPTVLALLVPHRHTAEPACRARLALCGAKPCASARAAVRRHAS